MDNVLNFIKSLNINKDIPIIIACSGGPDSMFLLDLMHKLGYRCICAHVHHNVRIASDDEYAFLENYCKNMGIIFEGTKIEEYNNDNFHEFARVFRYKFFKKLINKYHAKYLFTAHHADDLMETILMRLVRGSTFKGYKGFDLITDKDGYQIIRPLIYMTKDEIKTYNEENNILYVIDESNDTDHYTRNRYRHHVLPFLKNENASVHQKFLEYSLLHKEAECYIEKEVSKFINKVYQNDELDIIRFNKLDPFIKKQMLEKIISFWYETDLYLINSHHVEEIFKLIASEKPNGRIIFPNNVIIVKKYNYLKFQKGINEFTGYKYIIEDEISIPSGKIKKVASSDEVSNFVIRLNSQNLKLPLIVRSRINGDKMRVKNLNGDKKINDIFIDHKINMEKRNKWPIITDSNGTILWLPGLKKSEFDVPILGDYDIILKYEKGEF